MTIEQKETAMAMAKKTDYPQEMPCVNCGERWMRHKGLLCPDPKFALYMPGNTLFIPDEKYMERNPDFDVQ